MNTDLVVQNGIVEASILTPDQAQWLSVVAGMALARIIGQPLEEARVEQFSSEVALVRYTPIRRPDPVLPIVMGAVSDEYIAAVRVLVDHLTHPSPWGWYDKALAMVEAVVGALPSRLSVEGRRFLQFELVRLITFPNG